jgi:hypothetical protein
VEPLLPRSRGLRRGILRDDAEDDEHKCGEFHRIVGQPMPV